MRILIVDVNYEYKNPIYRQFYTNFTSCMETDFFGPGYVSRECLEKGINAYLDENGRYDAILLGTYFVYSSGEKGTRYDAYQVHRYTIPYYKINDAYQCCGKILDELKRLCDMLKIYIYYEDDPTMTVADRDMCVELNERGFYILGFPMECIPKCSSKKLLNDYGLTDYAYRLAEEYGDYYIPISILAIGYNEIFARSFSEREYDWCVPGNRMEIAYTERKKAHSIIKKAKKRIWSDDPYQNLSVFKLEREHMEWYKFNHKSEKIFSWLIGKDVSIASYPQMQYIAACREHYLESMRSSKCVYSEGGIAGGLVRKYFEACASGAVLVAKRVPGMSNMGFVHEKNCIIVDRYEDILCIDKMYDENQLEQIAKEGQKLIIDKHMFAHRALALKETIEAIASGRYKGAFWREGDYIIK